MIKKIIQKWPKNDPKNDQKMTQKIPDTRLPCQAIYVAPPTFAMIKYLSQFFTSFFGPIILLPPNFILSSMSESQKRRVTGVLNGESRLFTDLQYCKDVNSRDAR